MSALYSRPVRSPLQRIGFLLLVALACQSSGCASPVAPEPQEGVTDVAIRNLAFTPKEVTIKVGERVRWTNLESLILHTSTSGAPGAADGLWNSGTLSSGESFTTEPFGEAGEFVYYCIHHPNTAAMRNAMVIVEP